MPFNEQTHCPTEIREAIGLDLPYVNVPRIGDRSSESSNAGCDQTHCIVHMDPMSTKSARIVKRMITGEAWEAAPGSVDKAKAIGQLATNCGIGPPLATAEILEGQKVPTPSVTYYNCIGGFIVEGKDVIPKFISFVYWNMDPGHRIKWPDLTGRQQCE